MTAQRGAHYLDVIALLKPGVMIERAQAEIAAIASALNKQHPEVKARSARIVPEIQALIGPLRTPLLVLLGAGALKLLSAPAAQPGSNPTPAPATERLSPAWA